MTGLVRARWTDEILDECFRSVLRDRTDLNLEALTRTRRLMNRAVPDCLVSGYEELIDGLNLPDPHDRHVLAAAIRSSAQTIVTFNLKDFPPDLLNAYSVEAQHPDDFVLDAIDLSPGRIAQTVAEQASALRSPPMQIRDVLETLKNQGLPQSVLKLRELLG